MSNKTSKRAHKLVPYQIMQWDSVDGSPNRSVVRFDDCQGGTRVKFTVAYALPEICEQIMNNFWGERLIKSVIEGNLEQFRDYVSPMNSDAQTLAAQRF